MQAIFQILDLLITVEILALVGRVILEYIRMFSRDWRPAGFTLILAEIVYTATDPLVKLARRFIPPLRLGSVAVDMSILVLFLLLQLLRNVVGSLARG
ncbi:MAG: hypothetical protein RL745_529 [Actinomycetota bacterium]|jgi:YggT family protein